MTVTSSIVAGNQANTDPDISGWTDPGGNHNLIGGDPLLASLANNGGPTQTMALLPGSPALGGGDPEAIDASGLLLTTDQRGFPRPTGTGAMPDIGAFQTPKGRIVASFGSNGLWSWTSSDGWQKLSCLDAHTLVIAPDAAIVAGFGSSGLWRWTNGSWQLISSLNDKTLAALADGSIVAGFGSIRPVVLE